MEVRKITVVSTSSNSNYVIETAATTLGELKAVLDEKGISYEGMAFYEGISRTQLLDNNSQLPKDVSYKGQVTNELVFQLTTLNKKIRSGATSRPELYAKVKELELQDAVKEEFGKNFTQVSSTELEAFIIANTPSKGRKSAATIATPGTIAKPVQEVNLSTTEVLEARVSLLEKALLKLVSNLENDLDFDEEYAQDIRDILHSKDANKVTEETKEISPYDQSEINNMFNGLV